MLASLFKDLFGFQAIECNTVLTSQMLTDELTD